MRDRGFLLSTDGPDHNVIKIKPPMVIQHDDVNGVLTALDDVLASLD
jgi:4-aminobutyrate aminotransferase-like enzyme